MSPPGTLRILAWKVSRNFTGWHIARLEQPLCGTAIPDHASVCYASERTAPLLIGSICRKCLRALADEGEPQRPRPPDSGDLLKGPRTRDWPQLEPDTSSINPKDAA
jgi:hypothetical protein